MTDKQIQEACLTTYTEALENLPDDFEDAYDYLFDKGLDSGLCKYSKLSLDEAIYHKKWIKAQCEVVDYFGAEHWFIPPCDCENIE